MRADMEFAGIPRSTTLSQTGPVAGLDTLRVLALGLITWQHAATVLGGYATTQWRGISPGQSGVAVFCAIAGLLAFRQRPPRISQWFSRRLLRLFPAYWIVTLAAFALALLIPGKSVTVGVFASQMLGLGYFTHGWELVNVVSWFISLILLCYLLAAAAWWSGRPLLLLGIAAAVAAALVALRIEVPLSRHVLVFALAGMSARAGLPLPAVLLAGVLVALGIAADPQFFYAGLGLGLVWLAAKGALPDLPGSSAPARYAYEYFLVHGLCLVAAVRFIGVPAAAVPTAILAAMIGAVILHRLVAALENAFTGAPRWAAPKGDLRP